MNDPIAILNEIDARADAATDGPWDIGSGYVQEEREVWNRQKEEPFPIAQCEQYGFENHISKESIIANTSFIAHARTDLPRTSKALRIAFNWMTSGCDCFEVQVCQSCRRVEQMAAVLNGEHDG